MNEVTKRNTDEKLEKLMELNLQTAGNVNAISQQLGIISNKVDALGVEVSMVKDRMQTYEDTIRVSRAQADTIRRAIHARVCEILGIRYKDGVVVNEMIGIDKYYRPGFISKLYSDARKYSELGTPYYETFRKDYGAVLDYINGWLPQVGLEGYMRYLDERRRNKHE
jgi:hypothetical protein